jgi:hypothetical protein
MDINGLLDRWDADLEIMPVKKTSIASLQERLAGWHDWDGASYEVGACLGFWPEFGAPIGEDHWNGVKGVIWSRNLIRRH